LLRTKFLFVGLSRIVLLEY